MNIQHIIEPERQGLWIAATFVIALLALVLAFMSLKRVNATLVGTQIEVLALKKKMDAAQGDKTLAAPAPAAPASEVPAAK